MAPSVQRCREKKALLNFSEETLCGGVITDDSNTETPPKLFFGISWKFFNNVTSQLEIFWEKVTQRNFPKFTGNRMPWSPLLIKRRSRAAVLMIKATPLQIAFQRILWNFAKQLLHRTLGNGFWSYLCDAYVSGKLYVPRKLNRRDKFTQIIMVNLLFKSFSSFQHFL